jgi:hypothetical protein
MDAQTTAARAKASIAERAEARARKVAGMGDEKRVLSRALGAQREEAASVANRAIQETVPIHQRAAATGIMGTAGLATLGLAPWMALSAGGQRTLAGQAGWQKAGQAGYRKWMEQERLRKLADRLRTSGSRYIAGDQ